MTPDIKRNLLSGWLGFLDPALSEGILKAGRLSRFEDGATIYGFGQQQDCLLGIASGMVKMWVTMNEQEPRFGHLGGPGFWFGETEVVTGKHGIMEMIASGPTQMFSIPRKQIDLIAKTEPEVWPGITLLAVLNQGTAIGATDDLMIRNSQKRLAAVLLRMCSRRNAYQEVPPLDVIPISWNELSEAVNLSRSKVGAILSEFSKLGLIRTRQREILILDASGLQDQLSQ